jgi:ketosteroid isomerase-like protein
MSTTNTISGFGDPIVLSRHEEPTEMNGPRAILQSALEALSNGRISDVVELFADRFTFNDHALGLELKDKRRLTEFFEKSGEVFPHSTFEIGPTFENGDRSIAEWQLLTTESVPLGSISHRVPVSLQGSTIIGVENGRIVEWSEYYDQGNLPIRLAAFFSEWIEY